MTVRNDIDHIGKKMLQKYNNVGVNSQNKICISPTENHCKEMLKITMN